MATLETFGAAMARLSLRIEEGVERKVRAAALAVDQSVVNGTPVDTGRARSNWLVGINSPVRRERESIAPGSRGSTGGAVAAQAIAEGSAKIAGYSVTKDTAIYVSNNLDYIIDLENGKSRQAPAGFVAQGVQLGVEASRKIRLLR